MQENTIYASSTLLRSEKDTASTYPPHLVLSGQLIVNCKNLITQKNGQTDDCGGNMEKNVFYRK